MIIALHSILRLNAVCIAGVTRAVQVCAVVSQTPLSFPCITSLAFVATKYLITSPARPIPGGQNIPCGSW
jgi:hypothetical protein